MRTDWISILMLCAMAAAFSPASSLNTSVSGGPSCRIAISDQHQAGFSTLPDSRPFDEISLFIDDSEDNDHGQTRKKSSSLPQALSGNSQTGLFLAHSKAKRYSEPVPLEYRIITLPTYLLFSNLRF
jgi:hypothetical protein